MFVSQTNCTLPETFVSAALEIVICERLDEGVDEGIGLVVWVVVVKHLPFISLRKPMGTVVCMPSILLQTSTTAGGVGVGIVKFG